MKTSPLLFLAAPLVVARRPLLGITFTQRNLQADSCAEENSFLANINVLGNMNVDDAYDSDGVLFFYLSERRNYSSYIDCDYSVSPNVCNYTNLSDKMKPLCQYYGGMLYSATGKGECDAEDGPFEEINLPICLGPSCDVQPKVDSVANVPGCMPVSDYVAEPADSVLNEACQNELKALLRSGSELVDDGLQGIGSSDYVYQGSYGERYTEFCSDDNSNCDFASALEELKTECDSFGGNLYVYDDTYTSTKTYPDTGEVETLTTVTNNVPICVGASCPVDVFFNSIVFPAYEYVLGETRPPDMEDRNATFVGDYKAENYRAYGGASPTLPPVSDSCKAENDLLATVIGLGNMSHPIVEDGVLFFWTSEFRNYSSYFDCDESVSPSVCDYTTLRDKMIPLCEYYGGVLYSVSGQGECSTDGPFEEINIPICLGPSCDVQPKADSIADVEGCTALSDYVAKQADFVLSEACRSETKKLLRSGSKLVDDGPVGIGSSGYVYQGEYSDRYEEFCPGDGWNCDFASILDELKTECESFGGYLYVYDDTYADTRAYPDTSEVETSTTVSKNVPVCVGASCAVDAFFNQVYFPAAEFELSQTTTPDMFDRNATSVQEYTAENYRAISDVPNSASPVTSSPVAPTPAVPTPTTAPASTTAPAPTKAPATDSGASGLNVIQLALSSILLAVGVTVIF